MPKLTPTPTMSSRQTARLLKKLCVHDGDIVLVKKSKFDEHDILEMLKKGVEQMALARIFVIMVEEFDDLGILNRQDMNARGWYHIDQINRFTGHLPKK